MSRLVISTHEISFYPCLAKSIRGFVSRLVSLALVEHEISFYPCLTLSIRGFVSLGRARDILLSAPCIVLRGPRVVRPAACY